MTYAPLKIGNISTSKAEIIDILKAWLTISLTFAVLFAGISLVDDIKFFSKLESSSFWILFAIALVTVGIGFLFHEMAHKFTAQKFGCMAEFRSFDNMLFLALGLAVLIGFTFIAPGAVMISGMITRRENGIISAAGPLTNYALAMIFLLLTIFAPWTVSLGEGAINVWSIGFGINIWLGLFNMIPFLNFDGAKIFNWSKALWAGMVAFGVIFLFVM